MQDLKVALIQAPLIWEKKEVNLKDFRNRIDALQSQPDLILLPEMFNTGFSMKPELFSEPADGESVSWMIQTAALTGSVIAGTIMISDGGDYLNRSIWAYPDGTTGYYDKHHLFRMGNEDKHFSRGVTKSTFCVKGWNIMALTCYDLRFPCWSMNSYEEGEYKYDLLYYLANWPAGRSHHWKSLLVARAIENQAFVIGVNRTGEDGNGINHKGDSLIIDAFGNIIADAGDQPIAVVEMTLDPTRMNEYRKKFFIAPDWESGNNK